MIRPYCGLKIRAGGKWKKVARLIKCPHNAGELAHAQALYRAHQKRHVVSWKHQAISIDAKVWEWAYRKKAGVLIDQFSDTGETFVVYARIIDQFAWAESLGEGLQYRIPIDQARKLSIARLDVSWDCPWHDASDYPPGFQTPEAFIRQAEPQAPEPKPRADQLSLF